MKLGTRNLYLVLHHQLNDNTHRVLLADSIAQALDDWGASSRLSPIWATEEFSRGPDIDCRFTGTRYVTFLGPVDPMKLVRELKLDDHRSQLDVYITVGCFNVIVCTEDNAIGQEISGTLVEWAISKEVAFEQWRIVDGIVQKCTLGALSAHRAQEKIKKLAAFSSSDFPAHLAAVLQELQATAAASLSRAEAIHGPTFSYISEVVDGIIAIIGSFKSGTSDAFLLQTSLQQCNAALSRFASQATAGIPPIFEMQGHFWPHSLLGIGTANLAVRQLVAFIERVIGEAQLPQRVLRLADQTDNLPAYTSLVVGSGLLDFDILRETTLPAVTGKPLLPLVSFFSGRDGYSSKLQTLSLPSSALTECNSYRSNLLTVTHEISHIVIQALLAKISPTPGVPKDPEWVSRLWNENDGARNLLESTRKLFLEATLSIELTATTTIQGSEKKSMSKELHELLRAHRQETQEILVHTFDFLYFYRGDTEYYVRSIWLSWCAIPGIEDRVQEYLLRTLSAISANFQDISSEKRFGRALAILKPLLEKLAPTIQYPVNYIETALARISLMESDRNVLDEYDLLYNNRMLLVRLVKVFLHSDTLEKELYPAAIEDREFLSLDGKPIGNPLQYLASHLKNDVLEVESTWLFNILAFDPFFGAAVAG